MGSQTLEILRQGFWASFTGGWFFDPHQEIFCNTFHLYLWMYLLLLPFVFYLTTEANTNTLIAYPVIILISFVIIKLINIRLHHMFDGEEGNELESDKDKDIEEGNTGSIIASNAENENKKTDFIELDVLRKSDSQSDQENIEETSQNGDSKLKSTEHCDENNEGVTARPNTLLEKSREEEKDTGDSFGIEKDFQTKARLSSESSSSESSLNSNGGRAEVVVVDVHSNNVKAADASSGDVAMNGITSEKSETIELANDCSIDKYIVGFDHDEVIEKKPAVNELNEASTSTNDQSSKRSESPSSFPFNLWRLMESSSDSWTSSSSSMNTADRKESETNSSFNKNGTTFTIGKSENILSTKSRLSVCVNAGDTQEKAVSLSALEAKPGTSNDSESDSNRLVSNGTRPRNNQAVWFSLWEMEKCANGKGATACAKVQEGSTGDSCSSSLKHLNDMSDEEIRSCDKKKENEDIKSCEAEKENNNSKTDDSDAEITQEIYEEFLSMYDRCKLQRRGATRQSFRDVVRERGSLRLRRNRPPVESAGSSLLGQEEENSDNFGGRHMALTHEDTSTGAVHCFQDEFGHWHTYVFGDETTDMDRPNQLTSESQVGSSALLRDLLRPSGRRGADASIVSPFVTDRDLFEAVYQDIRHSQLGLESRASTGLSHLPCPGSLKALGSEPPTRRYYKLFINKSFFVKVWFDRLALLALLDRNKTGFETILAVIFGVLTAFFGYMLLSKGYFYDLWIFVVCFVIAKCQFSLLKSVQPDSASPIHGHNNVIVFSRAAYFCLISGMILILDEAIKNNPISPTVYGVRIYSKETLEFARDILVAVVLAFPLIFVFGLLPQINTFTMYFLEQLDIHLFGGTAMTSVHGSIYSFFRSIFSVVFLYGFCYGAMQTGSREQHIYFSIFSGILVAVCYHLSRCTSDPTVLWDLLKVKLLKMNLRDEEGDPLPTQLRTTVLNRIRNDVIVSTGIVIVVFAVHVSTVFTVLQPTLSYVLYTITAIVGLLIHYLIPQLRKQLPWLIASSPVLKSGEYFIFEATDAAEIMWFERMYVWLCTAEKNILYPLTFIGAVTRFAGNINSKFGEFFGPLIIVITGMKLLRSSFTSTPRQHIVLIWTVLFFQFDFRGHSETLPIDYFVMSVFVDKAIDLLLKFRFILTYTAPWQITWGSAFHAFAQPFSVPHCGMLFLQAIISSFFSAPLNPFLGSAIFITSYVRPTKFWEKNYNTKRSDHSNTRLSSHIDNNPCSDDNNLNSIFYEHLTRSLQHSLCGDLLMGRWGSVSSGDFFVIASDYLNALVHVIEIGNGFVTFQLRGLEFRGTYCQQRELEAITEWADSDGGCCCYSSPCYFSSVLSCRAAFNQRWLAWEVIQTKYIVEGYSVTDNTATSMFQVFDLRKIFITYYVKAIIYYAIESPRLKSWVNDENLMSLLAETKKQNFVDLDAVFRSMTDEDYDVRLGGVSRASFCSTYLEWIHYCNNQLKEPLEQCDKDSDLVTLCFALSLLGRRMFFTASHQPATTLKTFLHGLHALFKGDFRVSSTKDEWVFAEPDMELLRKVISPAVRMSVKLHQDHFTCPDEYDENTVLYDSISSHDKNLVISHEGDPVWRQAVLNNKSSLLALRYVIDEGNDDYKIITLNKRFLTFRVVKVNRECVRGLWAGQLQELIFLRNRNPERGSIQNAKQALRNMINSSCDQPIGYPIYVSPLTTSYADTSSQLTQIIGGPVSLNVVGKIASSIYHRLRQRYGGACNPSSSAEAEQVEIPCQSSLTMPQFRMEIPRDAKVVPSQVAFARASSRASYSAVPNPSRRSSSSASAMAWPPQTHRRGSIEHQHVTIKNISSSNLESMNDETKELEWPSNELKQKAQQEAWGDWIPVEGLIGDVIHRWEPLHSDPKYRSHSDKAILLLKIEDKYVTILESDVIYLPEGKL